MKTRIITGVVCGAAFLAVILLPPLVAYCLFSLICAVAIWETFGVVGLLKNRFFTVAAMLFAASVPFCGWFQSVELFGVLCGLYALVLVFYQLYAHETLPLQDTATAFFLTVLITTGIACTVYCLTVDDFGLFNLLLAVLIAWGSDIGAYFVGSFFGKRKLCPAISPKKTVEGFIGGWIFSVAVCLLLTIIWDAAFLPHGAVPVYWEIVLLAVILSPLSVVGDLFASVIKRKAGAKDYGNIMPGHGGIMDRFDSLLFVAPILFGVLNITSLIQGA